MAAIKSPTVVIEGAEQGNAAALPVLRRAVGRAPVAIHAVNGQTHFSVLAPLTRLLAAKVLADTGTSPDIALSDAEIDGATSGFAH